MEEDVRQLIHILVSLFAVLLLILLGRAILLKLLLLIIIFGSVIINLTLLGFRLPLVGSFLSLMERKNVRVPGWGSVWLVLGLLLLVSVFRNTEYILPGFLILGFGDGLATIIGRRGKHPIPFNRRKTIEGFFSMLLVSLIILYPYFGPLSFFLSFILSFVEAYSPLIDDNIAVPLTYSLLVRLIIVFF